MEIGTERNVTVSVPVVEVEPERVPEGALIVLGDIMVKRVVSVDHGHMTITVIGQDGNMDTFPWDFFGKTWSVVRVW